MTSVQIVVSLMTIVFSGLVSAVVTHRLSTSRQEREFRRKKLEELYLAVVGFCTSISVANVIWLPVMRGDLDYNAGLELQMKNMPSPNPRHLETATMIINIYFPTLKGSLEAILNRRDAINALQGEFKREYKDIGPDPSHAQFVRPFASALDALSAEQERFGAALFDEASRVEGFWRRASRRLRAVLTDQFS
jgi:hypothetical protein